jgi:hypothetical protein
MKNCIILLFLLLSVNAFAPIHFPPSVVKLYSSGGGGANGLLTNLSYYWLLDEATGSSDRIDTPGVADLTSADGSYSGASTTATTGKINNSISCTGNTILYNITTPIGFGDISFSVSCWVYITDKSVDMGILGSNGGGTEREWQIGYNQSVDRLTFIVYDASNNDGEVRANNLGSPSLNTWYHIIVYHDASNNVIGIIVNNGTANTTAWTTGIATTGWIYSIGSRGDNGGGLFQGRIDEVGIWKNRVLNSTDISNLYNSGNGLAYGSFN